jgi:hypothetical protein
MLDEKKKDLTKEAKYTGSKFEQYRSGFGVENFESSGSIEN